MATGKDNHTALTQHEGTLAYAAAGTPLGAAPTERPIRPTSGTLKVVAGNAQAAARQTAQTPPSTTCQQCLTLAFFFDGTGNNLDADVGTLQHSNVARLFQSHLPDNKTLGRQSFYIPGLGTYFSEIGDEGHTKFGRGFGHLGLERLNWAFKKFDEALKQAEARAENPTNKILSIKVSVFGFSRGATAARAFVRDLALRCTLKDGGYCLTQGNYPIEVLFLGLFDTVASVGVPMSANNTPNLASAAGVYSLRTTLNFRVLGTSGIPEIAFGEPGADPAPGNYNGHSSWADGLAVPAPGLVKRCVHMVAAHESRNSFPLDSALAGRHYPEGVSEMVYPGAHSDVGGGYQPGEGARSANAGDMLSLIPLRAMHAEARAAGVPLDSIDSIRKDPSVNKSYALDDKGAKQFAELTSLWAHYMRVAGSGGRDIGSELLAHSACFLRWRFFSIRRNQQAGTKGPDAQSIAQREPGFAAERKRLAALVARLEAQRDSAVAELERAQALLQNAQIARARVGLPIKPATQERHAQAVEQERLARDAHLREKAKLDTCADDSGLAANLSVYDQRLLQDAEAIAAHHKARPTLVLRPHYRNLLEAYGAHYVRNEPLDAKLVAFFDRYVHDSLAGFATDATLPSDPRVVYAGGSNKIRFAGVADPSGARESVAA